MAVLTFKEDELHKLIVTEGVIADNGDYTPGSQEWSDAVPCDAVPNGAAQTIILDDGTVKQYGYAIYLDPDCPEYALGTKVKLVKKNGETREAEILGFHRYQQSAIMWI